MPYECLIYILKRRVRFYISISMKYEINICSENRNNGKNWDTRSDVATRDRHISCYLPLVYTQRADGIS